MTVTNGPKGGAAGPSGARIDGRVLRGQRNRVALMNALTCLLAEGNVQPRAQQVAERASVSVRSLFQHFPDLDALYVETAIHESARVLGIIDDLDRTLADLHATEDKLTAVVAMRVHLWESTVPAPVLLYLRMANRERERVEGVFLNVVRRLRAQLCEAFGAELARVGGDIETAAITLQAAIGQEIWANLRYNQGLSIDEARAVLLRLARGALTPLPDTAS